MSYFTLDADNMNIIKEKGDMTKGNIEKQTRTPRHCIPHSDESKRKISESQLKRYDKMRLLIHNSQPITEDRIREIVDEAIDRYMGNHATTINNTPINLN